MTSNTNENNARLRVLKLQAMPCLMPTTTPPNACKNAGLLHFIMPGDFYVPVSLWDTKSDKEVPDSTDLPHENVDPDTCESDS